MDELKKRVGRRKKKSDLTSRESGTYVIIKKSDMERIRRKMYT